MSGGGSRGAISGGSSYSSDSQVGFTVGAGYEFSRHFVLEVNYMHVPDEGSADLKNFSVVVGWLGY